VGVEARLSRRRKCTIARSVDVEGSITESVRVAGLGGLARRTRNNLSVGDINGGKGCEEGAIRNEIVSTRSL